MISILLWGKYLQNLIPEAASHAADKCTAVSNKNGRRECVCDFRARIPVSRLSALFVEELAKLHCTFKVEFDALQPREFSRFLVLKMNKRMCRH